MNELMKIEQWLTTLNPDDKGWCSEVNQCQTFEELEEVVAPVVSEIGWLNLAGLAEIIKGK